VKRHFHIVVEEGNVRRVPHPKEMITIVRYGLPLNRQDQVVRVKRIFNHRLNALR
jgi:hypothetical protein